ncbi:MAG: thioredoxin family protein [Gammaproteobacteria bacterium]
MTIHTVNQENFDAFIKQNDLIVIDFSAEWCSPCKSFAKVFDKAATEFPQAAFGNIDIDKQPQLAKDFNVLSIPFVLILRRGIAVFAQAGSMSFATLANLIRQAESLDIAQIEQKIREQESKK